jgi:hypothetical protein
MIQMMLLSALISTLTKVQGMISTGIGPEVLMLEPGLVILLLSSMISKRVHGINLIQLVQLWPTMYSNQCFSVA